MLRLYTLCFVYFICAQVLAAEPVLSVQNVAEGVYVHFGLQQALNKKNHGEIANIGFIIGKRCVAVIDSGGNPQQGQALKRAIKKITPLPVCYVINTHVHPDHIYGNSAFKQDGVIFVGHYKLARAMAMRKAFYLGRAKQQMGIDLSAADIIPPDLRIRQTRKLDLGGRVIELTAHPTAHTDNDLSVYDVQTDTWWLSDLLFVGHLPVIDGSINGWIKELERLQKRKVKRVIPGHGPLVTNWPNGMQPELHYLKMLRTEIRAALKQGKDIKEAMQTVGLSAKSRWKLFGQFNKKNISTAYAELEWED